MSTTANSTNVMANASGTALQVLDYYPYGSTRISSTTNGFNEGKQFIAQYTDPETSLSYLQARYYDGSKGQFLSEDPVFLGDPKQQVLTDPQSLNSYSYGNDNPITKSDPNGREAYTVGVGISAELGFGAYGGGQFNAGVSLVRNPSTGQWSVAFPMSYGSPLGTPRSAAAIPGKDSTPPFMLGAYAGGGVNVGYSPNVSQPNQLYGVDDTINANAPVVAFSVSGADSRSPTYTLSGGTKGLASVSRYQVSTVPFAPSVNLNNRIGSYAQAGIARGSASYSAAVQGLQSQFASLVALFNALVGGKTQ